MSDAVVITLIIGIVVLFLFAMFRDRLKGAKGRVKGGGYEAEGEMTMGDARAAEKNPAVDAPRPGIKVEDARAGRDLEAIEETGGGIVASGLDAARDLRLHSSSGGTAPKE